MIAETQMPESLRGIAESESVLFGQRRGITVRNEIPDTTDIPIENRLHWLKIPSVICVFVDMTGSTRLSATSHDNGTAGAYQLFTEAAVRFFGEMDTPYIDVRGDGVFGLFNSNQPYRAIAAAVSFKTYAAEVFTPKIKEKTGLDLGAHIGIDQKTVLVRKAGLKRRNGRTDRQNEVWAGKPVNMASKLAAKGESGELLASDRFYNRITSDLVRKTCGCQRGVFTAVTTDLWSEIDVSEDGIFDFPKAWKLCSTWCRDHGAAYFDAILALDKG